MNPRGFLKEEYLLWEALLFSLGVHCLLLNLGQWSFRFHQQHAVEIDITNMGHLGMAGGPHPVAASQAPPKPAAPHKEWLRPAPTQKTAASSVLAPIFST